MKLRGAGKPTLWAVEDLDVTISDLGSVEYYGVPAVKKSVSGLGSVTSLETIPEDATRQSSVRRIVIL